jgi:hypothetical protein
MSSDRDLDELDEDLLCVACGGVILRDHPLSAPIARPRTESTSRFTSRGR